MNKERKVEVVTVPEVEIFEVKAPESLPDLGRWLNEWGDIDTYYERKNPDWKRGYEQAMSDAYDHFDKLMPDWGDKAE